MNFSSLSEIAKYIVADGKGILAADESNPTCKKRFDSISVESTEENRRDYRELLFTSKGMKKNIGGVILFDETIRQHSESGKPLVEIIVESGALPGIKVDKGLQPFNGSEIETLTQGLDGLDERCAEYAALGAKFTKWRAVISIGENIPSQECIDANMEALANYAKTAQVEEVAQATVKCLTENVPAELPGIAFLSGGQTEIESTEHLNMMNKIGGFPWKLSFSYGRALQASALSAWLGKKENISAAQDAFSHRAEMNKLASLGKWSQSLEE